jgi:hypothetical protein
MLANICTMPGEELLALTLQIFADEIAIVAVGDVAHSLGKEGVLNLDLFQSDRSLLAGNLGKIGDLVDQFARRDPAHREHILHSERQSVEQARKRKPDERGRGRAAENDDEGMAVSEHAQIAAHEDETHEHDAAEHNSEAG